jgi:RHS repeat-associated protein
LGGLANINDPLSIEKYENWEIKAGSLKDEMSRTINECLKNEYDIKNSLEFLQGMEEAAAGTMDRYFYHPDHLGSSSWITDGKGYAIQHLHYLPFGEDWVDQRNASWSAPYTFSGKEKDVETGYSYFGARYYDSGLSIWLSVDPMSDKYPNLTPYAYCANNPVILVDPDGRDIYTVNLNGDIVWLEKSETDYIVILDRKGNVRRNKDGSIKTSTWFGKQIAQEVSDGVLEKKESGDADKTVNKEEGKTTLNFNGNGREALAVFRLVAENTHVEWGIIGFINNDGEKEFRVGTGHNTRRETNISKIPNDEDICGSGNLLVYIHSHPYVPTESWETRSKAAFASGEDRDYWNKCLEVHPEAYLGFRHKGSTTYYGNKPKKSTSPFY